MKSPRRFSAPWTVEQIPGGYKVLDASGHALVYALARETREQADIKDSGGAIHSVERILDQASAPSLSVASLDRFRGCSAQRRSLLPALARRRHPAERDR